MVRTVLRIISVIMLSAFVCINAHAAWRIVFDRNCLKIVLANTASQKLIEEQHNQRGYHCSQETEGGTLYGKHGYHEGTIQAEHGEHIRFRD